MRVCEVNMANIEVDYPNSIYVLGSTHFLLICLLVATMVNLKKIWLLYRILYTLKISTDITLRIFLRSAAFLKKAEQMCPRTSIYPRTYATIYKINILFILFWFLSLKNHYFKKLMDQKFPFYPHRFQKHKLT